MGIKFNDVDVPIASYNGQWFLSRPRLGEALAYTGGINGIDVQPSDCIYMGRESFVPLDAIAAKLDRATGNRRRNWNAFRAELKRQWNIDLNEPAAVPAEAVHMDELTADWVKAKTDKTAAAELLAETTERETALWNQLNEERSNG